MRGAFFLDIHFPTASAFTMGQTPSQAAAEVADKQESSLNSLMALANSKAATFVEVLKLKRGPGGTKLEDEFAGGKTVSRKKSAC